ncbi:hypothetical protein SAMD00019534_022790 [Acytostelium subglobosum LB1]|uniref:hypothetical protein n=1 Tax=Acytostelium subglobosum LB1 TaxID=1410327 RepID=UPI000644B67D|nr:hypothetical protein SAMD00019534_022790 [Acytostelium subglobosum LB1]GAM19104.1 hypothetical protein SAMD00019534_022790 [Acytostelium subglobosum LB1]|eukprot:XP_012757031.1 hypothetical protein SAMD00019534_022790 [Acytostelium subglobosum LB1]
MKQNSPSTSPSSQPMHQNVKYSNNLVLFDRMLNNVYEDSLTYSDDYDDYINHRQRQAMPMINPGAQSPTVRTSRQQHRPMSQQEYQHQLQLQQHQQQQQQQYYQEYQHQHQHQLHQQQQQQQQQQYHGQSMSPLSASPSSTSTSPTTMPPSIYNTFKPQYSPQQQQQQQQQQQPRTPSYPTPGSSTTTSSSRRSTPMSSSSSSSKLKHSQTFSSFHNYAPQQQQQQQHINAQPPIKRAPSFPGPYSSSRDVQQQHATPHRQLDFKLIIDRSKAVDPGSVLALQLPNQHIHSVNNDGFELFKKLNYLDLKYNNIVHFNPFSIFPNLVELYLSHNNIQHLQHHDGFTNLTKLDLSHNNIDSNHIEHLMNIPKLVCLDLSFNNIETLPQAMSSFSCLKTLSLDNNQLSQKNTMESLSTIPSLRLLNLSNNNWDRIFPINGCFQSLMELSLYNNDISNLQNISNLYHTSYPLLTRVQLWGNPLKSTAVDFQVTKSIQLITDPPVTSGGHHNAHSPLHSVDQTFKQKLPFTYPLKDRKKSSTSSSSSGVMTMGGSGSGVVGKPPAMPVETPRSFYHQSPNKLNQSEPIFYRNHDLDVAGHGIEPFHSTPYKPPPPMRYSDQTAIFYNQQQQHISADSIEQLDDGAFIDSVVDHLQQQHHLESDTLSDDLDEEVDVDVHHHSSSYDDTLASSSSLSHHQYLRPPGRMHQQQQHQQQHQQEREFYEPQLPIYLNDSLQINE